MGALSSWASLAVTHHFLVQVAAWKAGIVPVGVMYKNYALLGDDLVIGDKEVYLEYISILAALGMPVNLHKSILSEDGTALEFAKRTLVDGIDVSPISFKELKASVKSLPVLVQFMNSHKFGFIQLLRALGYG